MAFSAPAYPATPDAAWHPSLAGVPRELANEDCRWPGWPVFRRAVLSPLQCQLPIMHALPQLQVPSECPLWAKHNPDSCASAWAASRSRQEWEFVVVERAKWCCGIF